jgi:hypothetical protein
MAESSHTHGSQRLIDFVEQHERSAHMDSSRPVEWGVQGLERRWIISDIYDFFYKFLGEVPDLFA